MVFGRIEARKVTAHALNFPAILPAILPAMLPAILPALRENAGIRELSHRAIFQDFGINFELEIIPR